MHSANHLLKPDEQNEGKDNPDVNNNFICVDASIYYQANKFNIQE